MRWILKFHQWLESLCPSFPSELPTKPPATLFGFVGHYSKPFWPLLVFGGLISIVITLIEVYMFAFVGNLVDWLANVDRDLFWETYKFKLFWMAGLILILYPVLGFVYESTIHQGILGNFAMRTRWQSHRYLLSQSLSFFQDDFAGRIAAKMMQTSLGVRDAVVKSIDIACYVAIYFTTAVIMFGLSDWRLSLPMIIWLIAYIITMRYFIPRLRVLAMEQADARSMVTGRVVDSYTNIETVKMFAHTDGENQYAQEGMDVFLDTVYRSMRLSTLLSTVISTINAILLSTVIGLGIYLWHEQAITIGAIAFAAGLVIRMHGMSHWVMWELARLFENIGIIQDGIETISNDVAITDNKGAKKLLIQGGEINFNDVSFNYGKEIGVGGVIESFSLQVAPGEKIGLVGRSGAGKSTLVNLLLRFYDIEQGSIKIDDQNISNVTQNSLRAQIGMVTQDTSLLHRSVYDNILYGRENATMEEVIAAAEQAKAHEFIQDLEDLGGRAGYQAHVGERGVKLSGGQRQRIAIARVLLKNAPILLLDEATSALDSEVEAAIQESLYSLMQGKTVIAIAHRLSTIAAMDRLVIMDQGKIIEIGNHDELIAKKGLYSELWARQSGGFLLESE